MFQTVQSVRAPAIFAIALFVSACSTVAQDATEVCIGGSAGNEVVLDADAALQVISTVSYGCNEVQGHMCSAEVNGDVIEVTTEVGFQNRPRLACESILRFSMTTCETPRLDEGSYTVRYAGQEATLDLPSSGLVQCMGG